MNNKMSVYNCLISFRGNQVKIKEHKVLVDQLKRELAVSRVKVSETTKELIKVREILLY